MSYPRVDATPSPAASATQGEIDAASRDRTIAAMYRCLWLLTGAAAREWRDCGKTACKRSRRCRGFACVPVREE